MARLLPKKTKWELVIRDKNFLDLNTWLSLVDTRFVLLFLEFTKKILASVYERSYESSIIPPSEKPLLKILAARWFLLSWAFAFKKTRAKRVHSAFGGFGGLSPWTRSRRWEFITVVKKYPLCILAISFKPLISFPPFEEIAPRLNLLSQKLSKSETWGNFMMKNGLLRLLNAFKAFRHAETQA